MEAILKKVAEIEGFTEQVSVERDGGGLEEGAQFHGQLSRWTLAEDGHPPLAVFIKTAPSDPLARTVISAREKFANEILFYTEIYPALRRHGSPPTVPRLVYCNPTEGREAIVLEDLTSRGYKPMQHRSSLPETVLLAALDSLARLHEASRRLVASEPEAFKRLADRLQEAFCGGNYFRGVAEKISENANRVASEYLSHNIAKSLKIYNIVEELETVAKTKTGDLVLTHGDFWSSNILVKYKSEKEEEIEDVALIDWQMTRTGREEQDRAQLLFTSGPAGSAVVRERVAGAGITGRFGLWMALIILPFALGQADPRFVASPSSLVFPPNSQVDRRIAALIEDAHLAGLL